MGNQESQSEGVKAAFDVFHEICSSSAASSSHPTWFKMSEIRVVFCQKPEFCKNMEATCRNDIDELVGKNFTNFTAIVKACTHVTEAIDGSESQYWLLVNSIILFRVVIKHVIETKENSKFSTSFLRCGTDAPCLLSEILAIVNAVINRTPEIIRCNHWEKSCEYLITCTFLLLITILACNRLGTDSNVCSSIYKIFLDSLNGKDVSLLFNLLSVQLEGVHPITTGNTLFKASISAIVSFLAPYPLPFQTCKCCLDGNDDLIQKLAGHLFLICFYDDRLKKFSESISIDIVLDSTLNGLNGKGIDASDLYDFLCSANRREEGALMCHALLSKHKKFRLFILGQLNTEQFILPLLEVIYVGILSTTNKFNLNHIYLNVVNLLIMSEDRILTVALSDTKISQYPDWLESRYCNSSLTISDLCILSLLRLIQSSFFKLQQFPTVGNALGILSNLLITSSNISICTCQRLFSLVHCIRNKLKDASLKNDVSEHDPESNVLNRQREMILSVFQSLLENVSLVAYYRAKQNPNFIYCLLYERELFLYLDEHIKECTSKSLDQINETINYFSVLILDTGMEISAAKLMSLIKNRLPIFSANKIIDAVEEAKRYRFAEQSNSSNFFVPYIWTLIYDCNQYLYWPSESFKLFTTNELH